MGRRTGSWVGAALLAVAVGGCGQRGAPESPGGPAPLEISQVMERAHFAYRPDGAGFRAGHTTYEVAVDAGGGWSFAPIHRTAAGPEGSDRRLRSAPAAIATVAVGAGMGPARAPAPTVQSDGSMRIDRGEATETLRNDARGVEQSWRFERAPSGEGELQVLVAVAGHGYTGETRNGLHFADPQSGIGFRYGLATWVDASGHRTDVRPRWEGGRILLAVPAEVVAASTFPAVLDPIISAEYGTDAPVEGAASGFKDRPRIAWNGVDWVVTWMDQRNGRDVIAARVSQSTGLVRAGDEHGILVGQEPGGTSGGGGMACNATTHFCLIAYVVAGGDVHARRLDSNGVVGSDIVASNNHTASGDPAVGWNGTNYLVVWQDSRLDPSWDLYGERIDASGTPLDDVTANRTVATGAGHQLAPDIASSGSSYLVVYTDDSAPPEQVKRVLVDSGGTAGASLLVAPTIGAATWQPAVAWDGSNYIVVWHDGVFPEKIRGAQLTSAGALIDRGAGVTTFDIYAGYTPAADPSVASNGTNILVTWDDGRYNEGGDAIDVFGQLLTKGPPAQLSGSNLFVAVNFGASDDRIPATASNGTDYGVAFLSDQGNNIKLLETWFRGVLSSGALGLPQVQVSKSMNDQRSPTSAFDGTHYFVAWADDRTHAGRDDLYGGFINPDGSLASAVTIATGAPSNNHATPAVARGTSSFLVVYAKSESTAYPDFIGKYDIWAVRVNFDGTVGTPQLVSSDVSLDQTAPAVAFDGTNFFAVWNIGTKLASWLKGAKLSPDGTVLIGEIEVSGNGTEYAPKIAYDNQGNYLVVWQDLRNAFQWDVWGTRVRASDGVVLDGGSGVGFPISNVTGQQAEPSLAFDGQNYIVTWTDSRSGSYDIWATRVGPGASGQVLNGGPGGGARISPAGGNAKLSAHVVFEGTHDLFAWREDSSEDLKAARALPDLSQVVDSTPLLIAAAGTSRPPSLATNAAGTTLVSYARFDPSASYGSIRVRGRLVTNLAAGADCSTGGAAACASGFCVSNVCCTSACNPANTTTTCSTGSCQVTGCSGLYRDCDGVPDNGCELNTANDVSNCGGCGAAHLGGTDNTHVCSTSNIQGGTSSCASGICQGTCTLGWGDCNSDKTVAGSGCELPLTSIGQCGVCPGQPGATCDDTNSCTVDLCVATSGTGVCQHVDRSRCSTAVCSGTAHPGADAACQDPNDSDGDGLPDAWETAHTNPYTGALNPIGIDVNCDGVIDSSNDVLLPNANPTTPNVYVKYDYFVEPGAGTACTSDANCTNGEHCDLGSAKCVKHTHAPSAAALTTVRTAFANHGVTLTYFTDPIAGGTADAVDEHEDPSLGHTDSIVSFATAAQLAASPECTGPGGVSFFTLKGAHYPSRLAPAYHYAVFSHYAMCDESQYVGVSCLDDTTCQAINIALTCDGFRCSNASHCAACPPVKSTPPVSGSSGVAENDNFEGGNDLIVSLGPFLDQGPVTDTMVSGAFMHELGHNLGLTHGGGTGADSGERYKPNYLSVMGYSYNLTGVGSAAAGPYPTTTSDPSTSYRIDYSTSQKDDLAEGSLNEANGISLGGAGGGDLSVAAFYTNAGTCKTYGPTNRTGIDWDCSPPVNANGQCLAGYQCPGSPYSGTVSADISASGSISTLSGHNDWATAGGLLTNIKFKMQCAADFSDGAGLDSVTNDELTVIEATAKGLTYVPLAEQIVVRPGCPTKWIAPSGPGNVTVVLLASASFDVNQVNLNTLGFAGAAPIQLNAGDVNGDGRYDLWATFPMASLHLLPGATTGTMGGQLLNTQPFSATDAITIVPNPNPVVTIANDGSGFCTTLNHDKTLQSFTLASCVTSAVDVCGNSLAINTAGGIIKITADEASAVPNDMFFPSSSSFQLRRTRNNNGDGRVYTVYFRVVDGSGNVTNTSFRIQVPRNGDTAIDSGQHACVGACP